MRILQNAGIESDFHFGEFYENKTTTALSSVFQLITEKFKNGEYDLVYIINMHFINTLLQKAEFKKILPISIEELVAESKGLNENRVQTNPYLYEPGTSEILDRLLPEYFQTQIFLAILESIASEHSARMISMKNATDNAKKLQQVLTLKYNRQRQATITQQLIEVVNGRAKPKNDNIF